MSLVKCKLKKYKINVNVHFAGEFKKQIPDYLKSKKQSKKCVFLTKKRVKLL